MLAILLLNQLLEVHQVDLVTLSTKSSHEIFNSDKAIIVSIHVQECFPDCLPVL